MPLDASVLTGATAGQSASPPTKAGGVLDAATSGMPTPTPAKPQPPPQAKPDQPAVSLSDRLAEDRANVDAKEPQMPVLSKPPTQTPQTDPFQAFGQPAMWMAMLGSLFTRRPFTSAVLAAGAVLKSTAQKDAEAAKQHFETWKIETENGLKMAKFQQDAYDSAIKKLDVDTKAGKAELETHILAFKDEVLSQAYAHGGVAEVKKLLFARGKQAASVASGQAALGANLKQNTDMVQLIASDDPLEQAQGAVMQAKMNAAVAHSVKGDPAAKIAADNNVIVAEALQARIARGDDAAAAAYDELKARFGVTGTWKPPGAGGRLGTATADRAAVEADIQREHPDWTPGQVAIEVGKKVHIQTAAGAKEHEAEVMAREKFKQTHDGREPGADDEAEMARLTGDARQKQSVMAGRTAIMINRNLTSAADAVSDLKNVVELPITIDSGMFGGRRQGPGLMDASKEVLANTVTSEDAQAYNAAMAGLERSLGGLATGGLAVSDDVMKQFGKLEIVKGDTNAIKLRKLATMRQNVENALDGLNTNPQLSDDQRAMVNSLREKTAGAIPWTVHDVNQVEFGKGAGATVGQYAKKNIPNYGGQPPVPGAKLAPDGKWYVPDPARPGKYLMVQ